jgi:polyisoprenoid-binding protein YceI
MKPLLALFGTLALVCSSLHAGNYQINKEASEILVDSHATPPHTVTSYVREYQSDIQMDPITLTVSSANFSFKVSDLDSEHEKRDKKMYSWIGSTTFPEIVFKLSDVSVTAGQSIGKGTLSMHGVSKNIEAPFTVTKAGENIIIDGSATFSYEDWDLEIIKLFLFRVRPELMVKFHLEGTTK